MQNPWAGRGLDHSGIIHRSQGLWDIVRKAEQVMRQERLAEKGHGTLLWKVVERYQNGRRVST